MVLAALHLVTVFLLGREPVDDGPRTKIEPPEQQRVERDDTVDRLIASAPAAGGGTNPQGANTPAASGIASAL